MSQYLRMFLDESEEYLQSLNQNLLALENNPEDEQLVNEIFRAAHSLKGMAATMGFDKMANLTHEMENVLDRIRAKKLALNTAIVDILFSCLDRLEALVREIADSGNESTEVDDIIAQLNNVDNLETDSSNTSESNTQKVVSDDQVQEDESTIEEMIELEADEKEQVLDYLDKDYYSYLLTIELVEGCLLKSVRGFMAIKNLKEMGVVVKSEPSLKDIEDEKFEHEFKVLYATKEAEKEIEKAIIDIIDIKDVDIQRVRQGDIVGSSSTEEVPEVNEEIAATAEKEIVKKPKPKAVKPKPKRKNQDIKVSPTVRVDIEKLDSLMNLVAELLINKTRLEEISNRNDDHQTEHLTDILQQLDRVTMNLQNTVMQVRMVPIERIFNRFPRMVRDLSKELNKKVNLVIEGADTELDRSIIDSLGDPLVHLLRNAIDHGIEKPETRQRLGKAETAELHLSAAQKGNEILIQVTDDGRGLDPNKIGKKGIERGLITQEEFAKMSKQEKVNLIFRPGFSTSEKISDVSGRGVGLDVVKKTVESLDGHIDIDTELGKGTTFNISLPLTLAITQALLVKVCSETYAIPLSVIEEAEDITPDRIKRVRGQEVFLLRGDMIPLVWSHKLLGLPLPDLDDLDQLSVVVIKVGKKQVGLIVTELINQQDIVIKSLGELLVNTPHISGATILGDGEVALILDVRNIA